MEDKIVLSSIVMFEDEYLDDGHNNLNLSKSPHICAVLFHCLKKNNGLKNLKQPQKDTMDGST